MTTTKNPYRKRLDRAAWEAGRICHQEGTPRDVPRFYRDPPALERAWLAGWDDAAELARPPRIEHHEPVIQRRPPPPVTHRGNVVLVVPPDEDLGPLMVYVRPRPVPCPACRRLRLDTLSPACVQASGPRAAAGGDTLVAYMRCRCCQHRFSVTVR